MVKRPDLIKRNKERTQKRIKIICPCRKEFEVLSARVKEGAKYCSVKCYHRYANHNHTQGKHWNLSKETKIKQGLHQIGIKNHNWQGGITKPRINNKNKKWVRSVKKLNKFCVICGTNKYLVAHHLDSFDINKEKRYKLDNGIILCNKHHKEFHKKYCYGKNTKKQFNEWKENMVEEVIEIKDELMKKGVVYNLSLEGGDCFYANGIKNHNTDPHIIRTKNKKVLANKKKGLIFGKIVHHPGTTAQPFFRPALDQVKNVWVKRFWYKNLK